MGKHKAYQGHRNYNAWNISLYLFNDEATYRDVQAVVGRSSKLDHAAKFLVEHCLPKKTPDGVPYTVTNVRLALQHFDK